jgi:hypothetical protein
MMAMLPAIVLFIFAQKQIVRGMVEGSIKKSRTAHLLYTANPTPLNNGPGSFELPGPL